MGSAVGGRDIQALAEELRVAAAAGQAIAPVWVAAAARTRSCDLAFVAAAWSLSEATGAPLADAVKRAVAGMRSAAERRRRVGIAIAGPRATVATLTGLPLLGPLFGLACGISPAELYLGNALATVSMVAGLALVWLGRLWCRRLVRSIGHA